MMKCLILEDEKAAQKVLKSYIEKTPFLECIGIYETGLNIPIEELQKTDILFLDIQLPELNGLSFFKTISNPPKVIVTTAFSSYAIEAFEEIAEQSILVTQSDLLAQVRKSIEDYDFEGAKTHVLDLQSYLNSQT